MDSGTFAAIPFRTFPQLSIGPVTIRTFGAFVAIGIVVGVWVFLVTPATAISTPTCCRAWRGG